MGVIKAIIFSGSKQGQDMQIWNGINGQVLISATSRCNSYLYLFFVLYCYMPEHLPQAYKIAFFSKK
ncbi:hypothetical protein HanPI659440_Chr00c06g0716891 [Helianthus annuus]|nr:hypothetical protein HanPI659440_Chr00c06g0716891 [Helianthus annuus]